jgi:hypothetical protein
LTDNAPGCSREQKFESYLDRKVAIDASMHIYQFMVRAARFNVRRRARGGTIGWDGVTDGGVLACART